MAVRKITARRTGTSFGFVLKGECPCVVDEIKQASSALSSGLKVGDIVISVNGIDVRNWGHYKLVQLIQRCGLTLDLVVKNNTMDSGRNIHSTTFSGQADYLLTKREKQLFRTSLINYNLHHNIQLLVGELERILDTNSKKQLWRYIIQRMTPDHQAFVLERISLPRKAITPTNRSMQDAVTELAHNPSRKLAPNSNWSLFKQKIDFLLTPNERYALKLLLQNYANLRHVENLLESLQKLFDTPSKRSLWKFVLPLLSEKDRRYCISRLRNNGIRSSTPVRNSFREASPREGDVTFQPNSYYYGGGNTLISTAPNSSFQSDDSSNITRSTVRRRSMDSSNSLGFHIQDGEVSVVTVQPDIVIDRKEVSESSTQTDNAHKNYRTLVRLRSRPEEQADIVEMDDDAYPTNANFSEIPLSKPLMQSAGIQTELLPIIEKPNDSDELEDSQSESYMYARTMSALRVLDDAVADELTDDLDTPNEVFVPPAPPIPPPPPPLPVTVNNTGPPGVKRINWEKIEKIDENSLWAQIPETNMELEDVVKFLEIEQQFSTKKLNIALKKRQPRITILNSKKAYNISILLGQLKKSAPELRESLLMMDDNTLSADLLNQLLMFLPDANEKENFNQFTGKLEDLSIPDQYMYEISRIPSYKERLRALSFKNVFPERIRELQSHLGCIQKASLELQISKKLAKALELVLAIGNYMNKGNARVGQAVGFKISFLSQLEMTKTSDKKGTFLNVLAEALNSKYPQLIDLRSDLPSIPLAAKVSLVGVKQEIDEIKEILRDSHTAVIEDGESATNIQGPDKFQSVMQAFLKEANETLDDITSKHQQTIDDYNNMLKYFGEENGENRSEIFEIMTNFVIKFEEAHKENLRKNYHKNFSSPRITKTEYKRQTRLKPNN